ncbi:MAG: hypothetical protein LBK82_00540 [Planctomycetaceae bacterium]|nr:hypothetical protein [Planctomycetaceae bacterium]
MLTMVSESDCRLESGAKSANADMTFQRKVTHLVICLPLTKITIPLEDT